MIERLFPKQIDTAGRSNPVATLILIPIVVLKLFMGFNAAFLTRFVVTAADGIPIDHYGIQGSQAVVAIFSMWGLEQFLLAALGLLVLVRYRGLIPLVYVVLAVEHFGRKALLLAYPFDRVGGSAQLVSIINWAFVIMLLGGLLFALVGKSARTGD